MRTMRMVMFVVLVIAGSAAAQFGRGPRGPRPPQIRGILNPTIGSGAVYQSNTGEVEISLVGKEDVGGKPGYWIQTGMKSPEGQMYMKQLMVVDNDNSTITRMVVQPPSGGPMEMPATMFGPTTMPNVQRDGHLVGTESIATPAGTFSCQHFQANNGSWDIWVSSDVPPWGLVKSKDASGEMTLLRTIASVPDRIKGTPQKLDLPEGFKGIPEGVIPGR